MAFQIFSFCETPPGVIKEVDCGVGISADAEYSYFNSEKFSDEFFTQEFIDPNTFLVLAPPNPNDPFMMYNLASSSTNSGISSSGIHLQFIDTAEAGSYLFHVHFSIRNPNLVNAKPLVTITLGTPAATPYTNAINGFLQVATEFEPTVTITQPQETIWIASMHGVVDLPAGSSTAVLLKPGADEFTFDFSTFNVTVEKLQ